MAQSNLITAHLQENSTSLGSSNAKRTAKVRRTTLLWSVGILATAVVIVFGQLHHREKADKIAAEQGKIPTISTSTK